MHIYILRHGQTALNKKRCLQGHLNTVLNEEGIAQARQRREYVKKHGLHFGKIFCSPLERALQTCEIVSGEGRSKFVIDDRLAEMEFGELDGVPYADLTDDQKYFFTDPGRFRPAPGGETFEEVDQRLSSFFTDLRDPEFNGLNSYLREQQLTVDGDRTGLGYNVLITSHGTVIHTILHHYMNLDYKEFWDPSVSNCTLIEFQFRDDKYEIIGAHELDGVRKTAWKPGDAADKKL